MVRGATSSSFRGGQFSWISFRWRHDVYSTVIQIFRKRSQLKFSSQHFWKWELFSFNQAVTGGCRYGRNFFVKCKETSWCEINIVIGSIQKYSLINTGPRSCFLEVFWKQHLLRFVLTDNLQINILTFVTGHGTTCIFQQHDQHSKLLHMYSVTTQNGICSF